MLWRTHFVGGVLLGGVYSFGIQQTSDVGSLGVMIGISGLGALLPDIDSPYSKSGRTSVLVSSALNTIVGHRGFFHSVLGLVAVTGLIAFISWSWLPVGFVSQTLIPLLGAGYLSHLLLDALTPGGVPLLWPYRLNFRIPIVKTGSLLERLVVLPVLAVGTLFYLWGCL